MRKQWANLLMVENLLFLAYFSKNSVCQQWMALALTGSSATITKRWDCDDNDHLTTIQKRFCKDNVELMNGVIMGAYVALLECKYQFKSRRWNCSTVPAFERYHASPFGLALKAGTREAAFVHAIFSAGVSYAVTKECGRGKLGSCACDNRYRGYSNDGVKWSGCSDNVPFGTAFSRAFVDSHERERERNSISHERLLMNLHNNEAGRKIIRKSLIRRCKCHGVSGSCATKTCSKVLAPFRQIGHMLKEQFDCASHVQSQTLGTRLVLLPRDKRLKPVTSESLVYLEESPTYCRHDPSSGSLGTRGRICKKGSKNTNGCSLLCCDRGYTQHVEVVQEKCKCKFHWCCEVTCKICRIRKKVHRCL